MKLHVFGILFVVAWFSACGGCSDDSGLLSGEACEESAECRGECVGGTCEGYGEGGFDGETCNADADCRGTCDGGSCTGGGTANNTSNNANNVNNGTTNTVFDTNDQGQVLCKNDTPCACDDGMDNDGDGLIDGFDPECTGPYDDDEETFATGIPGDNVDPKWQDCFFDGNSGAGDDGCRYHSDCLTGDLPLDDGDCSVATECVDFCGPRTPNGCDCFGCCEVTTDGGTAFVLIGSDCSLDDVGNCTSCVQNDLCVNTCGRCELCLGKTEADLPADCSDGGGFVGTPCNVDSQCQGVCTNGTCEGHGGGGQNGDDCMADGDCRGICGADDKCTGGGSGFHGDDCAADTECVGDCTNDTCEGYGSGGYDGEACQSSNDCRGDCGANNTCTGGGSGGGSGVQCEDSTPCEVEAHCEINEYCQQGCCKVAVL